MSFRLKDNDGRKLSLKYFCLMCYRFRIISEIRSSNEFSSRETKTPAIRMNAKMLNAFLLFSRKRNNEMSLNFHILVLLHVS